VQRRENQADSDPRLQLKPFIYWGFLRFGSRSFTGIFTCLAVSDTRSAFLTEQRQGMRRCQRILL
jgi:hypothetical protein